MRECACESQPVSAAGETNERPGQDTLPEVALCGGVLEPGAISLDESRAAEEEAWFWSVVIARFVAFLENFVLGGCRVFSKTRPDRGVFEKGQDSTLGLAAVSSFATPAGCIRPSCISRH